MNRHLQLKPLVEVPQVVVDTCFGTYTGEDTSITALPGPITEPNGLPEGILPELEERTKAFMLMEAVVISNREGDSKTLSFCIQDKDTEEFILAVVFSKTEQGLASAFVSYGPDEDNDRTGWFTLFINSGVVSEIATEFGCDKWYADVYTSPMTATPMDPTQWAKVIRIYSTTGWV